MYLFCKLVAKGYKYLVTTKMLQKRPSPDTNNRLKSHMA